MFGKKVLGFWWFKPWPLWDGDLWPFKGLNDLQLLDQKVTVIYLVDRMFWLTYILNMDLNQLYIDYRKYPPEN